MYCNKVRRSEIKITLRSGKMGNLYLPNPMELNLANLYHCSDFMNGDLANLCIPEQRVVTFAQDRKEKPKKFHRGRRGNKMTSKSKKNKFE